MAILSYISIPVGDKVVRIDLTSHKVFMKNENDYEEIADLNEMSDDNVYNDTQHNQSYIMSLVKGFGKMMGGKQQ